MSKQDRMKMQTYVFRVNIHCEGCKDKVKKLIQKIEGVYSTSIDAEQGKVVVSGAIDPVRIIKKLKNSGKHAELWSGQRPNANNQNDFAPNPFNHFLIGNGKGGKDNKSQQKGGQQQQQQRPQLNGGHLAQMHMKGSQKNDFKFPSKEQKSVRFNMQDEEFDVSDDDFDGSDDYDEFDEDFDDDDEDDDSFNEEHEYGPGHHVGSRMTPTMGNGYGHKGPTPTAGSMMYGQPKNGMKSVGREASVNFKKGGVIDLPVQMKGNNGKNNTKNVNDGRKGKGGGEGFECKSEKGGKGKGGGGGGGCGGGVKNKNGVKGRGGLLGFLGFGKKSSKNGEGETKKNKKNNNVGQGTMISGGGHTHTHHTKGKEGKKAVGKFDGFHDVNTKHGTRPSTGKFGQMGPLEAAQVGGINKFPMGPTGPMGQMGNYPMGQMRDFSAVQGLPAHAALNGGYNNYQGQPMQPTPPYQQYMPMPMPMPMMMNQQHQPSNGTDVYQPMMYGRPHPHPSLNYMPPPPMPSHPMNDPVTHIFSDENTESCSIM